MGELLLFLVVVVGLTTFAIALALRWSERQIRFQVERRFRHADEIVNGGRIPAEWLRPFRAPGKGDQAQVACLRNLDALIAFFEKSPFVDNPETRQLLLDALQRQRAEWQRISWDPLPE
jgi:hypothetical protein